MKQKILAHPAVDELDSSPGSACKHMVYLKEGWNHEGTSTICADTLGEIWKTLQNYVTQGPVE